MLRLIVFLTCLALPALSQEDQLSEEPMTYERLGRIIFALDPEAQPQGPAFFLKVFDVEVIVVTDVNADRMRAMVPVIPLEELSEEDLLRVLQANFDTALDARYAVANDMLWAVFIHPLSPLEKDEFIEGLGQTVNIVLSYGTLYSGGALQYGGGDSTDIQRDLIDELLRRGEEI